MQRPAHSQQTWQDDPRNDFVVLDLVDDPGAVVDGHEVAVEHDQLGQLHAAAALR